MNKLAWLILVLLYWENMFLKEFINLTILIFFGLWLSFEGLGLFQVFDLWHLLPLISSKVCNTPNLLLLILSFRPLIFPPFYCCIVSWLTSKNIYTKHLFFTCILILYRWNRLFFFLYCEVIYFIQNAKRIFVINL